MINPFAGFNANLMEDDDILKYWITPPGPLSDLIFCGSDLISSPPIFFMGGRGCGKTMILKYMSNEIQLKKAAIEGISRNDFFENLPFIGIYYRFDGPTLSIFQKRNISEIEWETIFRHYMEIVLCQKYLQMLDNFKSQNYLEINESEYIQLILDLGKYIFDLSKNEMNDISFQFLIDKLELQAKKIFKFTNSAPFNATPKFESEYIFSSGSLIFGVPKLIAKHLPSFNRKKIVILLDEYENALKQQQLILNTLIKHVQPPVTFLIGSRYNGIKSYDTLNKDEFLMEDADYRRISFEEVVPDNTYVQLIRDVANKRLEKTEGFRENGLSDIEQILGYLSQEKEARRIVFGKNIKNTDIPDFETYNQKRHLNKLRELIIINTKMSEAAVDNIVKNLVCEENPLIDILNIVLLTRGKYSIEELQKFTYVYIHKQKEDPLYQIYERLYDKNKLALVFQLVSFYPPTQKEYAGFRVFSKLSSGLVRNFIELCYQSFKNEFFDSSESIIQKKYVDFESQTKAANTRAERFFKTIENIPEYGNEIKSLVQSLGAIYSSWYSDPRISEPEITYFFVDTTTLPQTVKDVLNKAVQWSVLQQKEPMKGKSPGDPLLDVYVLNHILAPKFSISYRSRGRMPQFMAEDLTTLIFGSDTQKTQVTNKLKRNPSDYQQTSLFDSWV